MTEKNTRLSTHRQIRLHRLRLAMLGWCIAIALTFQAWLLGLLDLELAGIGAMVMVVMTANLLFHVAIRSGWSERLRDPSLTLVQILTATLISLWVISHADEARTILLMLFIISIFFGVFHLRAREFLAVALTAVAGFALIGSHEYLTGRASRSVELMSLELGVFATVMFWLAWIGSYVAALRRKLDQRNRELEQATEHLTYIADHDELTGLPNRRQLLTLLNNAHARALADNEVFTVAVVDLDHFKKINDQHGHPAGDEVLAEFARRANDVLRGQDQVMRIDNALPDIGRFGGEEFLAVMPDTPLEGAIQAAERLRLQVAEVPFQTDAGHVRCTVSIGLAEFRHGEPLHHTVGRADKALYRAKHEGRNRVRTSSET